MKKHKDRKKTMSDEAQVHTSAQRLAAEEKRKALELEKKNAQAHRRRVSAASDKRALPTAFTKAYYRFSREYPSTVTENGDRLNEPLRHEKPSVIGIIAVISALLLVFSIGFVLTDTAIGISQRDTVTQPDTQPSGGDIQTGAVHALKCDLTGISVKDIPALCEEGNYNAVCLDYKDDYGYINFISKAGAGDSAKYAQTDASHTVDALHEAQLKVIMRVSCFLDTAASNSNSSWAALKGEGGGVWYDSESAAWLNPYSQDAVNYLTNVISEVSASGADYILLDNVCFSPQTKSLGAFYPGESSSSLTPNSVLRQFITTLGSAAGGSEIILSCRIQGFTGNYGENYSFYAGNLLDTDAPIMACDMRLSRQSASLKIGSAAFENAADIPYVFVLTASEYAVSATGGNSSLFAVLEQSGTTQNELNAVSAAGIKNYIIMN